MCLYFLCSLHKPVSTSACCELLYLNSCKSTRSYVCIILQNSSLFSYHYFQSLTPLCMFFVTVSSQALFLNSNTGSKPQNQAAFTGLGGCKHNLQNSSLRVGVLVKDRSFEHFHPYDTPCCRKPGNPCSQGQ